MGDWRYKIKLDINRISSIEERELFLYLIDFINGKLDFNSIEKDYYFKYQDSDDDELFQYSDFHCEVCEKIDFTTFKIDEEHKKYGWMDVEEFKNWLINAINQIQN